MRGLLTVVIFLSILSCDGDRNGKIGSISKDTIIYEILNYNIRMKGVELNQGKSLTNNFPSFEVTVQLSNNSNKSFILYNFTSAEEALAEETSYYDRNKTAGNAVFVVDKDGDLLIPMIGTPHTYKAVTEDTLLNALIKVKNKFINNSVILKPLSKLRKTFTINFHDLQLEKGHYKTYLIYCSGDNITNILSEKHIEYLKKENNADIFKGWIKSNSVKLIVE